MHTHQKIELEKQFRRRGWCIEHLRPFDYHKNTACSQCLREAGRSLRLDLSPRSIEFQKSEVITMLKELKELCHLRGQSPTAKAALPVMTHLVQGDITKMQFDAIVNPAQNSLQKGGSLDGSIHAVAGPELQRACLALNGCATGEAKATPGYRLPSRYVIHTVGPVWRERHLTGEEDILLASCYRRSLEVVENLGLVNIAFPGISTGVYGFPKERAAKLAVQEVRSFRSKTIDLVVFVCFDDEAYTIYEKLLV